MSTQRNSTPQPSRGRNVAAVIAAVIAPVAATIAACSGDSVTSPMSAARTAAAPIHSANASVALTSTVGKVAKSLTDSTMRKTADQLTAMAATWHTEPGDMEFGIDKPLPLACGVSGTYTVTQAVGPNGGVLHVGASSLTIPKGALSNTVQIGVTVTLGQGVTVDFAPHGTQFAKAVTIVTNYTGCTVPTGSAVNVYYTDGSGHITQSMPTSNDPAHNTATSLTDHFSGYAVAWGRSAY